MLRVLTLATLFPNVARPTFGVFVERQTLGLANSRDVEVQVVAPIGCPPWPLSLHPRYRPLRHLPDRERWKGVQLYRPVFPIRPQGDQSGTPRRIAARLRPVLAEIRRTFPFDVIDAEFFWPDGPVAMALAGDFGVPFSVKARGSDIHLWGRRPDSAPLVASAARRADGLLAVSEALKSDMVAIGLPGEKIRTHYTGIDLDRFRPLDRAEAKRRLGLDGPLLVCPGTLSTRKGQDLAIQALGRLDRATLFLVGDGPDRAAFDQLARKLGLADRVRFLGNRPHDEMPELLAAADVMVLPTVSEGLANVWVETLACGTPVVTTDLPCAREAIDPGCGRLVPRSAEAIAKAVSELIDSPLAQGQVRRSAERFSWQRNSAELVDHLSAIVARFNLSRAA